MLKMSNSQIRMKEQQYSPQDMIKESKLDANRDKIRGLIFQAKTAISSTLLHHHQMTPGISILPNGSNLISPS